MKIILTGFDTFNNDEINPSYEAIKNIKIKDVTIKVVKLPVVYNKCFIELEKEIISFKPDYVLCFGLASGRKYITPEQVAINYMYCYAPDNENVIYNGEKIISDNVDAIFTSINLPKIIDELNKNDDYYRLSLSAGAYVCNNLYYHVLKNQDKYHYRGLFTHVPNISDMSLDVTTSLILKLINKIVE